MTSVAAKASLACWESSYQALSRDGNPRFATVLNVLEALDFRLYPMMGVGKRVRREGEAKQAGPADSCCLVATFSCWSEIRFQSQRNEAG